MNKAIRTLALVVGAILSAHSFAVSTVYEISKGKNKLYLAGTIHLLREEDFPLPAEFGDAYKKSNIIIFETDLQKAKTPDFSQRFTQAMILPDNKTLKDILSADIWLQLQTYSAKSQYPLSQTMMFNPTMTSLLIMMAESKKYGIGEGVDVFYDKTARADNKLIGELETSDDVIGYMKACGQENPDSVIKNTLADVDNLKDDIEKLIGEWKSGNLTALDKDMAEQMRNETPQAYTTLVVQRNKKWLPKIENMLSTPDVEMVLVGSLHLSGKDGLLAKLKKAGYVVKPYRIA